MKSYSELIKLESYEERIEYLRLNGIVGLETFGYERYLNQQFYRSPEWKRVRTEIILRDQGCDLAIEDYDIQTILFVHHIIPVTLDDILNNDPKLYDPENLVCTSKFSHDFIHYGVGKFVNPLVERKQNDQTPWR